MNILQPNTNFKISSFYYYNNKYYDIHIKILINPLIYNIQNYTEYKQAWNFYPVFDYPEYFNNIAVNIDNILDYINIGIYTKINIYNEFITK